MTTNKTIQPRGGILIGEEVFVEGHSYWIGTLEYVTADGFAGIRCADGRIDEVQRQLVRRMPQF